MKEKKPPPKTGKQRQQALRQRRAEEGMTELRGVYMPTNLHAQAKQLIAAWLKKHRQN